MYPHHVAVMYRNVAEGTTECCDEPFDGERGERCGRGQSDGGTNLEGIAVEIDDAPDAKIWGIHLDHLAETSAIGCPTDDYGKKVSKEVMAKEKIVYCRYKVVHKDELEARAIFDLMVLNLVCSPLCVEFTLLGGRAFVAVLRSIPFREKKMRIFHADVANSYYQILVGRTSVDE